MGVYIKGMDMPKSLGKNIWGEKVLTPTFAKVKAAEKKTVKKKVEAA